MTPQQFDFHIHLVCDHPGSKWPDLLNSVYQLSIGSLYQLTSSSDMRALLRRSQCVAEGAKVQFGDVEVDFDLRSVRRAGVEIHLTPTEFKLLGLLVQAGGKVLTQRRLLAGVWGPNHVEHVHYLRVYMAGLRRKLEADPARPCHILTESGVGYRLLR